MSSKKRVLIFTPGGVGGAERMSVLIGKLLPPDKFEVKFVIIGRLRNIYDILPAGYAFDCIAVRNIYEFSTFRIWRKIVKEKPDIVFTSQVAYNPRIIIAAKFAGTKVIVRSSGMLSDYSKSKFRQVRMTYPIADILIAQQEDMREEMIRLLNVPSYKVVSIHNPLDTQTIDELCNVPSPYPDDEAVNYVQTASVNYRKAQDISLKAFSIVKKSIPNAKLYFVGDYCINSSYYNELQHYVIENDLQDSVRFVGYDNNPFRWVKNADCFLLPSRAEGLPNALIEASYLGIPCVAARCLNIVEDIINTGNNGYTVCVDDVDGFAHSMIKAIKLKNCKMIYRPGTSEDFVAVINTLWQ